MFKIGLQALDDHLLLAEEFIHHHANFLPVALDHYEEAIGAGSCPLSEGEQVTEMDNRDVVISQLVEHRLTGHGIDHGGINLQRFANRHQGYDVRFLANAYEL